MVTVLWGVIGALPLPEWRPSALFNLTEPHMCRRQTVNSAGLAVFTVAFHFNRGNNGSVTLMATCLWRLRGNARKWAVNALIILSIRECLCMHTSDYLLLMSDYSETLQISQLHVLINQILLERHIPLKTLTECIMWHTYTHIHYIAHKAKCKPCQFKSYIRFCLGYFIISTNGLHKATDWLN